MEEPPRGGSPLLLVLDLCSHDLTAPAANLYALYADTFVRLRVCSCGSVDFFAVPFIPAMAVFNVRVSHAQTVTEESPRRGSLYFTSIRITSSDGLGYSLLPFITLPMLSDEIHQNSIVS